MEEYYEEALKNLSLWLTQLGYASSTINQTIINLNYFFKWLIENNLELENPYSPYKCV